MYYNCHVDDRLDELFGEHLKLYMKDGTEYIGYLTPSRREWKGYTLIVNGGVLLFYKSHVRKVEVIK